MNHRIQNESSAVNPAVKRTPIVPIVFEPLVGNLPANLDSKEVASFEKWRSNGTEVVPVNIAITVVQSPGTLVLKLLGVNRSFNPKGGDFSVITFDEKLNGFTKVIVSLKQSLGEDDKERFVAELGKLSIMHHERQKCSRQAMLQMTNSSDFALIAVGNLLRIWKKHPKSKGPTQTIWTTKDGSGLVFYNADGIKEIVDTDKVAVVQVLRFKDLTREEMNVMSSFLFIFNFLQSRECNPDPIIHLIAPGWHYLPEKVATKRKITSPLVHHQKPEILANTLTSMGSEVADVLCALGYVQRKELSEKVTFRQVVASFNAPSGGIVKKELEEVLEHFSRGILVDKEEKQLERSKRLQRISKSKKPVEHFNQFSELDEGEDSDVSDDEEGPAPVFVKDDFPRLGIGNESSQNTNPTTPNVKGVWGTAAA